MDILMIPFIKLSLKPLYTVHHIGKDWKHIKNKYSLFVTNIILSLFVKKILVINNEQKSFFKCKDKVKKIHTILNKKFSIDIPNGKRPENYILYIGRIHREKGIDDLLEAYKILFNNIDNIPVLKLVGPINDEYKSELYKKLENNGMSKRVQILSPVYNIDEKINLIDKSMFGIYPSYKDAFPLTVLEFFSRKKICIGTKIAETKNFLEYDDFLIEPGNIIELTNKMNNIINNEFDNKKLNKIHYKSLKYSKGYILKDLKDIGVI